MSNTLDKLKALNDKLEAKLTQTETTSTKGKSAAKTRTRDSQKKSEEQKVQISYDELVEILIKHLSINSDNEPVRAENIKRVAKLYLDLNIIEKAPDADRLFVYKAMNISAISLKEEDFGEIREGKYVQVIAITYEPDKNGKKKAKNISLGYFGKAETLADEYKNEIIEFVLRWRYEKAFQNLEHYKDLISNIHRTEGGLF